MCGRYVTPEGAEIERAWHIGRHNWRSPFMPPPARRFNVAPQQGEPRNYVPVIRQAEDGNLEATYMQWWLLPYWSKEPRVKYSTFNARVEEVEKKSSFRDPLRFRRCILPAVGWYEWQDLPGGKQPWFFHAANGDLLSFAGLWDRWKGPTGQVLESCTLIVGDPNPAIGAVHDRMPLILPRDSADAWLDRSLTDPAAAKALLRPTPPGELAFHRVSTRVNNARNEGAELMEKVDG